MPDPRVDTHALLPLTLLPIAGYAQLACLIQAANVRSEPGSNPSKVYCAPPHDPKATRRSYFEFDSLFGVHSKDFLDPHCQHHHPGRPRRRCDRADQYHRVSIHLTAMPTLGQALTLLTCQRPKVQLMNGLRSLVLLLVVTISCGDRGNDSRHRGSVNRPAGIFWEAVAEAPAVRCETAIVRVDSRRLVWLGGPGDGTKSSPCSGPSVKQKLTPSRTFLHAHPERSDPPRAGHQL